MFVIICLNCFVASFHCVLHIILFAFILVPLFQRHLLRICCWWTNDKRMKLRRLCRHSDDGKRDMVYYVIPTTVIICCLRPHRGKSMLLFIDNNQTMNRLSILFVIWCDWDVETVSHRGQKIYTRDVLTWICQLLETTRTTIPFVHAFYDDKSWFMV